MVKSGFDPYGDRRKKFELFPAKRENPIVVAFLLFLIFLVVRLCMLVGGMPFIRIPYLDPLLAKAVSYFPK